jgi:Cu(I)/Ag(I) efflux system membrane fusion protein
MFATVSLTPAARKAVLLVPSEAVIQTGTRSVVFIASDDGKFTPVEVETGSEANGQTEIRSGLSSGQKVVASGQFLVDSEASLKGAIARMGDVGAAPTHHGRGRVEKIDPDSITLSHEAIPTLQWGPMTMPFKLPPSGLPRTIAVGDQVTFEIRQTPEGDYQITSITPADKQTGSGDGK